jgi:hypothetical protein
MRRPKRDKRSELAVETFQPSAYGKVPRINVDIEHRPFLGGTDKGGISLLSSYTCKLNCRWSPFSIGLHLFADIDPRGAGELDKSSERDSDSCVGGAPSGHHLLETL